MTRKPDDVVGTPGEPAVGGGHQTPEQARMTAQGGGGRSDADRAKDWDAAGGEPGRAPVSLGGSSGGHADQKAADDPEGRKRAAGSTRTEQTGGKTDW